MYQTIWFVKGRGPFPIDLLRASASFPNTHVDSESIARSFKAAYFEVTFNVALVSRQARAEVELTLDVTEWEGTGWEVVDISEPREVVE